MAADLLYNRDFHYWPIASFRFDAEYVRYRNFADSREPSPRPIYGVTAWFENRYGYRSIEADNANASACPAGSRRNSC